MFAGLPSNLIRHRYQLENSATGDNVSAPTHSFLHQRRAHCNHTTAPHYARTAKQNVEIFGLGSLRLRGATHYSPIYRTNSRLTTTPESTNLLTMSGYPLDHHSLPSLLYRVQYEQTRTSYTRRNGLQAASQDYLRFGAAVRNAIKTHYDWASRVPSPLVSTFTNYVHAERWAARRPGVVTILTISTAELRRNDIVFERPGNNKELFFLHKIPARAIVEEVLLDEFS